MPHLPLPSGPGSAPCAWPVVRASLPHGVAASSLSMPPGLVLLVASISAVSMLLSRVPVPCWAALMDSVQQRYSLAPGWCLLLGHGDSESSAAVAAGAVLSACRLRCLRTCA